MHMFFGNRFPKVADSEGWRSAFRSEADGTSSLREYNCLVRVKTSITLPKELLTRLDRVNKNRSLLLERAAIAYLAQIEKENRDRKDIEIINRNASRLNREARDTMEYQQAL